MKKYLFGLILLVFCRLAIAQNVEVVENSFQKVAIAFTSGTLSVENVSLPQGDFSRISMEGFDVSNNPGGPMLPMFVKLMQIPVCDSVIATVVGTNYSDYPASELGITHPLYPSQPSVSKNSTTPPFVYNQAVYTTDTLYSLPLASVEKIGIRRGDALANVYISPVQYNPVTQTVRIYSQIDVEFTFVNANILMTNKIQKYDSPLFTLSHDQLINPSMNGPKESSTAPIKYLIVANSMFASNSDLAAFVAWKRRLGYLVEVAYTSDANVGTSTTSIKNYIQNRYNNATAANPAPTFLLLVGDVAQLPAFTGQSDNSHVTDLYYATLAGNDNIPDCYYGRLSATSNAQLSNQIAKIMMYESYSMPDPSYLGNAVLIAGTDGNGYSPTHADGQVNYIYNNYINTNSTTHNYTTVYKHNYNCSSAAATIRSEINAGVGLANYTAHGSYSGWADPAFSTSHVSSMTNAGKYGLLIGNCCLSGKFDESECFGESLLRAANKGAMGYIGASNSSYWNEDVYWAVGVRSSINSSMSYMSSKLGVYDKMFHTHGEAYSNWAYTIGGIVQGGNLSVQSSSSSRKLYYWEIYHCFGDPSVRVYLGIPSAMTVTASSTIAAGSTSYTAQVAPYAYVALTSGGNLVSAAYANASGSVSLTLPQTLVPGEDVELVALAQNYIPYFQTVTVLEGSGVTCFRPLHLTCTEVTGSTASLSWTEYGTATHWVLQYSTDNTFGTYSEVNVSGFPSTILTCLTSGSTYYARVKSDCGDDGESQWSSVCTFLPKNIVMVEVGDGTTNNQYLPSYSYYKYELSQQLYTSAEIGDAGTIHSISFYNGGNEETRSYDLYLVNTSKNAFSSNTDWISVSNANKVFSGTVTMAANAWTTLTFDTPFEYDGTSNLALVADDNTGSYTASPHMSCRVFSGASNCAIYKYNDNTDYDPASMSASGTCLSVKNQIRINIARPTPPVIPTYVAINGSTLVCPGESTTLTASSDVAGSYAWSTGITGPQITVGEGTYTVTVTTSSCHQLSQTVTVASHPSYSVTDTKTVCESELPYFWNGAQFVSAGTKTVTLHTVNGCDSVVTMTLTVNHGTHNVETETACESYEWHGITYEETGIYTYPYTDADGCASVDTLKLTVNHGTHNVETETACESYVWHGMTYEETGAYTYSYTNADGCASVDTLKLTVNHGTHNVEIETACEKFVWHGKNYTTSGIYTYEYINADGCVSVDTLKLTVNHGKSIHFAKSACEEYVWNGVTYDESGSYNQTFVAVNGCDSVVTMHLTVKHGTHNVVTDTACVSYTWHGTNYTVSGAYTHDYVNTAGCESTDTLHLIINQPTTGDTTAVACESFTWYGTTYTESGDYTSSVSYWTNAAGCDSVVTLHLTINNPVHTAVTATACERYVWHNMEFTASGDYTYSHEDANSCTQVDTLHLTINTPTFGDTIAIACGSFTWYGTTYTESGDYTSSEFYWTNAAGCDSVVTLHLTINNPVHTAVTATACESYVWHNMGFTSSGDYTYSHEDANSCTQVDTLHLTINTPTFGDTTAIACGSFTWYGTTYTESGDYASPTSYWSNVAGCDSVVTLHLTINNPVHTAVTATACERYVWHNMEFTASGDYTYSHEDANSCTQVDTLHLTINTPTTGDTTAVACESFTWYGTTYTESGDYTSPTSYWSNVAGCDSVVTMHLTIHNPVHTAVTETACESYEWNGTEYTTSGDYTYSHTDANGCTQVDTLHLTIHNGVEVTVEKTVCESELPYFWNGELFEGERTESVVFIAANHCDSVVTMVLMVNPTFDTHVSHAICQGENYDFFGTILTETGVYTDTLQAINGCDSIITLSLTVNTPSDSTLDVTVIENHLPFVLNGISYDTTGIYYQTFSNAAGCDSLLTINLTVHYNVTSFIDSVVCQNELPVLWNGITCSNAGVYIAHLTSEDNTDSTVYLSLTVNPTYNITLNHSICQGDSYDFNGTILTGAGIYIDSLRTVNGCDSVITLYLKALPTSHTEYTETACESFSWNDVNYIESGDYMQTFTNIHNCDSVVTLHLTINTPTTGDTAAVACESFTWYGTTYTESGDYMSPTSYWPNAAGCDSVVTLHLTINNPVHTAVIETACESYEWNGTEYTVSGDYTYGHTDSNGCTQVDTLHLTINHGVESTDVQSICENELPIVWNGVTFDEEGMQQVTFTAENGCDSVVSMVLTVNPVFNTPVFHVMCQGDSYDFFGNTLTETGIYVDTLQTINGCDSIITLSLTVNDPSDSTLNVTVIENQLPYTLNNDSYNVSGTYNQTLTNAAGCDSVLTIKLTVLYNVINYVDSTLCENALPIVWNGITCSSAGVYTAYLTATDGTDSTVHLTLKVNPTYNITINHEMCQGESYDFFGNTLVESGTYKDTLQTVNGCDSVVTLHLTVNQPITGDTTAVACESFTWYGTTYTESGDYTSSTSYWSNVAGCDSVVTLHLTIHHSTHNVETETACESYEWHDTAYTQSGTYTYAYANADGCASVDTLHLTINTPTAGDTTAVACGSFTWYGTTYTESGDYTSSTSYWSNVAGCDSVVTLHLTIHYGTHNVETETACESYVWHDTTYAQSGTYTYAYTNADGCASVDTLHLTINTPTTGDTTAVACGSFTWYGTTYTESGDYTSSTSYWSNVAGCDSVVTLHLTIHHSTHNVETETACESYEWHDTAYTQSGTYTYAYSNAVGCASVDTLHLTIHHSTHNVETETACESYVWHDTAYTQSGTYTYAYTNAVGCASVDTLHLTINTPTTGDTTAVACESFTWYGTTYTESGDYTSSTSYWTNATGCDSVVTLHLTINNPVHTAVTETACESYEWNGTEYTVSGDYTFSHTDANGCTQVDTLHLTIHYGTHNVEMETACESYEWHGETYTQSGTYTYAYSNADGCASVDTLHLTIHYGTHNVETETACESYVWHDTTYTQSGTYTYAYSNAVGCSSVDTLHLTITNTDHTDFTDEACDSYTWNGETFTQSGTYTQTFTNSLGCDSVVSLHLTVNHSVATDEYLTICENELPYHYINGQIDTVFDNSASELLSINYYLLTVNGCDSVVTLHLTITVGVNDYQNIDFKVYPNPTNSVVNVQCIMRDAHLQGVEIHLVDMYGKLVRTVTFDGESTQIDLSDLAAGVYFVKWVLDSQTIAVRKVVKQS